MNTPQTKKEFQAHYRKLVRSVNKMLLAYEEAAFKSGSFSLDESKGCYHLPKNVLTAALNDVIPQYASHPWNRSDKKMVRDIQSTTYPDWSGL